MKLRKLPHVMALSAGEKLELIDEIWGSIAPELEGTAISDEEKHLIDERLEKHLAKPEKAITLEELKAEVASRLK